MQDIVDISRHIDLISQHFCISITNYIMLYGELHTSIHQNRLISITNIHKGGIFGWDFKPMYTGHIKESEGSFEKRLGHCTRGHLYPYLLYLLILLIMGLKALDPLLI